MEQYVEKLARLRLKVTTQMMQNTELCEQVNQELEKEMEEIIRTGITEAEYKAMNEPHELKELVQRKQAVFLPPTGIIESIRERWRKYKEVVRHKHDILRDKEDQAILFDQQLSEKMARSIARSQSLSSSRSSRAKTLIRTVDRQGIKQQRQEQLQQLNEQLREKEQKVEQQFNQLKEQRQRQLRQKLEQLNGKLEGVRLFEEEKQQEQLRSAELTTERLQRKDDFIMQNQSRRAEERKIKQEALQQRLKDAGERSRATKEELERLKAESALRKKVFDTYVQKKQPKVTSVVNNTSMVREHNQQYQEQLEERLLEKDRQEQENYQKLREENIEHLRLKSQQLAAQISKVRQRKEEYDQIADFHNRLKYYEGEEHAQRFVQLRNMLYEQMRATSQSPAQQ